MPLTEEQLATKLKDIKMQFNDDPEIDVEDARRIIAEEEAEAIHDFVVNRQTTVTGTSATGGAVTGTGIIQTN